MAKFTKGQRVRLLRAKKRGIEATGVVVEQKPFGNYVVDWKDPSVLADVGLNIGKTINHIQLEPAVTLEQAVEAFLSLGYDEPAKPFRTQRDMREFSMQEVELNAVQDQFRHMLVQAGRPDLAEHHHPRAMSTMQVGTIRCRVPREYDVRRR